MKIVIATLGSRGDVQPFVALGVGLKRAGHEVTLCTGKNFESFVHEYGLDYFLLDVDYLELMQDPEVRKQMGIGGNPLKLLKMANDLMRTVIRDMWTASQGADALVYHPKILSGASIAEALKIPGFFTSPMPITPTGDYPNVLMPQNWNLGKQLNRATHSLFLRTMTAPYRGMVNDFRRNTAHLPPLGRFANDLMMNGKPVPVLYPFSRHVVPRAADWGDHIHITGYWFLDASEGWQPPAVLVDFLNAGAPPVYIGFGSMAWNDPERAGRIVLEALRRTGQRGVLAKGWGGLSVADLPETVYMLDAAPHDWLFPRMSAVVHHGGAGTTAAALRAGKPSLICPFIADQPFWGKRVHDLGVGAQPIPQKKLTVENLTDALRMMASDVAMQRRAAELGEKIRAEDGVGNAVGIITRAAEKVTA